MKIFPVLDILGGQVVRGVAGRRHEYRPIVSQLVSTAAPLAVGRAIRARFGFTDFYVADLDALAGAPPAFDIYRTLQDDGFVLWVDAGVQQIESAVPLFETGVNKVVLGLESIAGPEVLHALTRQYDPDRLVFSLDLKTGQCLTRSAHWTGAAPFDIAAEAIKAGLKHVLVLDLARVGVGQGTGTEELCTRLARSFPQVAIAAGGGIRDRQDLAALHAAGVQTALIASCLHDGRFDLSWLDGLEA